MNRLLKRNAEAKRPFSRAATAVDTEDWISSDDAGQNLSATIQLEAKPKCLNTAR
jgi:hypothetical protein